MNDLRRLQVPAGLAGERVDAGVARLTGLSRTKVADLIAQGRVRLDGAAVMRSDRLLPDSWLEIEIPSAAAAQRPAPVAVDGLTIVLQDADLVVIDKPVGVAAHASPGWTGPTVTSGLAALGVQLSSEGAAEREGIVHRLDVGTSGLMVVAKSARAYTSLKRQFKDRTVTKTYHALVQGHPDPSSGRIDAPIGRHPQHDYRFAVVTGGKPSVTNYETLEAFSFATLLTVGLETGRTHQIRVHMAALRHPCCGDLTYGADPALAQRLALSHQWLHAVQLSFDHPATGERVSASSDYPPDLARALELLA